MAAAIFDALSSFVRATTKATSLNSRYFWLHYIFNTLVVLIGFVFVQFFYDDSPKAFICSGDPFNQDILGEFFIIAGSSWDDFGSSEVLVLG